MHWPTLPAAGSTVAVSASLSSRARSISSGAVCGFPIQYAADTPFQHPASLRKACTGCLYNPLRMLTAASASLEDAA